MEILVFLIPASLLLVTGGVLLFNWAVKNGQYDDLDGPAHHILYDDDQDMIPDESRQPDSTRKPSDGGTDAPSEGFRR